MITRSLLDRIKDRLNKGKVIVLVGRHQVGKTTLINQLLKDISYLFLTEGIQWSWILWRMQIPKR